MDVHDIDEYGFPPIDGAVFAMFAAPGFLPRLRSLDVTIAWADIQALRTLAASSLAERLESAYLRVQFPETTDYRRITTDEKLNSGGLRLALEAFLAEHG